MKLLCFATIVLKLLLLKRKYLMKAVAIEIAIGRDTTNMFPQLPCNIKIALQNRATVLKVLGHLHYLDSVPSNSFPSSPKQCRLGL